MQYPNYLSQIAALIRENPSITVREIADKLQFADNKSVYYWLSKSNVNGINEFKRLVLAGENPLALPRSSVRASRSTTQSVCLSLLGIQNKKTLWASGTILMPTPTPRVCLR